MEGTFYRIYFCTNCNTSFALPVGDRKDKEIYNLIYQNADRVSGYDRYYKYYNTIKDKKSPMDYLASSEEAYWIVNDTLKKMEHKSKSEISIVEIGCGLGYLTYALNKEGYKTVGIDISQESVANAILKFGHHYICANVNEYAKNHHCIYDVAILTEVIEHIEKPVEFLQSISFMLKEGGRIILTAPNKTIFGQIMWHTDLPPLHLWWFSETSMLHIGNILDMNTNFVDFTDYYKYNSKESIITVSRKRCMPKPEFNLVGQLINPTSSTNQSLALQRNNVVFKLMQIPFLMFIYRKIKYKVFFKSGKTGSVLGVIFEKGK